MENQGRSERSNVQLQKEPSTKIPLPKAFIDFLALNGLNPSVYDEIDNLPRYIRLKPGSETLLADVEAELGCKLENVNWLPGFFAIASQIQIARSKVYCEGKIYGIDAASGAAVTALNVLPGDHILDLCAAPELQDIRAAKGWPCRSGRIPRAIRFDPCTSRTSGLFIAKVVKLF